jgi:catechol 2,3-dioxygenase-like lactoylglutathione lyase family enzyme
VSDLERSTGFFETLFGTRPLERTEWRGKNTEYVATMAGRPGLTLDCIFFQIPHTNTVLELMKYHSIPGQASVNYTPVSVGAVHLCFFVPDFEEAIERVRRAGGNPWTSSMDRTRGEDDVPTRTGQHPVAADGHHATPRKTAGPVSERRARRGFNGYSRPAVATRSAPGSVVVSNV